MAGIELLDANRYRVALAVVDPVVKQDHQPVAIGRGEAAQNSIACKHSVLGRSPGVPFSSFAGKYPLLLERRPGETAAFALLRAEFARPGAQAIDFSDVGQRLIAIKKDREIVFLCNCPNEASAASAAKQLIDLGFSRVRPLAGGFEAWVAAGYKVAASVAQWG